MTNLNTERILFTEPMAVHTNVYPNAESMKPILTNIILCIDRHQVIY